MDKVRVYWRDNENIMSGVILSIAYQQEQVALAAGQGLGRVESAHIKPEWHLLIQDEGMNRLVAKRAHEVVLRVPYEWQYPEEE